jgi:hypothetical protein
MPGVDLLVDGERDGRAGVAEPLRDDFHRLAGGRQQHHVRVAKVAQPNPR